MPYWLLKTEPETFSWQDQLARGTNGECWDGVRNHQAAKHLRQMQLGDQALFYHTGKDKSIQGIVTVIKTAFPDPSDATGRFVAVQVQAVKPLPRPVTLAQIKAETTLADCLLVRQSRLSVMPITTSQWRTILRLAA